MTNQNQKGGREMNKECFVDIIELDKKGYIRCLMDGTMTEIKPMTPSSFVHGKIPTICPHCKRPIFISRKKIVPKTRMQKQFYLPHLNRWINY